MNKEVLISMVNSGKIRFIPLRRCSLCNEYIGYKFVRMYDGNTIPVFSSGCRCCGINIGSLSERTWDEVLDLVKTVQNKPIDKIEDLTMDETDGFVDTTGIVTSIKSKDVVEFYVENPFVKIKDE